MDQPHEPIAPGQLPGGLKNEGNPAGAPAGGVATGGVAGLGAVGAAMAGWEERLAGRPGAPVCFGWVDGESTGGMAAVAVAAAG